MNKAKIVKTHIVEVISAGDRKVRVNNLLDSKRKYVIDIKHALADYVHRRSIIGQSAECCFLSVQSFVIRETIYYRHENVKNTFETI